MAAIKVLLADDHRIIRQGLRSLLESQPDMQVVGEAENGASAIKFITDSLPDVVVMDLRMPDMSGIEATRQALAANANVKVIGLSAYGDRQMTREMLRAGALGYVLKDSAFEELAAAIRTVVKNKVYLSHAVADAVGPHRTNGVDSDAAPSSVLSPREREVLQLMSEGKSTKEAANLLSVSVKTIETHRRNIMEKLNMDGVADLTRFAIREGITGL